MSSTDSIHRGSSPVIEWRAVSEQHVLQHPLVVALPDKPAPCSYADLRLFSQNSRQWAALHERRLTTSKLAGFLGVYEGNAASKLGVPRSLRSRDKALSAWRHLSHSPGDRDSVADSILVADGVAGTTSHCLSMLVSKAGLQPLGIADVDEHVRQLASGPTLLAGNCHSGGTSSGSPASIVAATIRSQATHALPAQSPSGEWVFNHRSMLVVEREDTDARLGSSDDGSSSHSDSNSNDVDGSCQSHHHLYNYRPSHREAMDRVYHGIESESHARMAWGSAQESTGVLAAVNAIVGTHIVDVMAGRQPPWHEGSRATTSPPASTAPKVLLPSSVIKSSKAAGKKKATAVRPQPAPATTGSPSSASASPPSVPTAAAGPPPSIEQAAAIASRSRLYEIGLCSLEALPDEWLRSTYGVGKAELPLMGASPDGLIVFGDGTAEVVEVKCHSPFAYSHHAVSRSSRGASVTPSTVDDGDSLSASPGAYAAAGAVPHYVIRDNGPQDRIGAWHVPQIQMEILCAGPYCDGCNFVTLSATKGARVFFVPRNDEYIGLMLRLVSRFHSQYVKGRKHPALNFAARDREYNKFLDLTLQIASAAKVRADVPQAAVQRSPHNRHFFSDRTPVAPNDARFQATDHDADGEGFGEADVDERSDSETSDGSLARLMQRVVLLGESATSAAAAGARPPISDVSSGVATASSEMLVFDGGDRRVEPWPSSSTHDDSTATCTAGAEDPQSALVQPRQGSTAQSSPMRTSKRKRQRGRRRGKGQAMAVSDA